MHISSTEPEREIYEHFTIHENTPINLNSSKNKCKFFLFNRVDTFSVSVSSLSGDARMWHLKTYKNRISRKYIFSCRYVGRNHKQTRKEPAELNSYIPGVECKSIAVSPKCIWDGKKFKPIKNIA